MTAAPPSRSAPRIALVGCGAIAELAHAPALRALAAQRPVEVVALVDPDAGRRAVIARFFPQATQLTALSALDFGRVDLAIVASPPRFHAEQATALLERGCAVLVEKPLATRLADAEAVVDAARRHQRLCAVALARRHYPAWKELAHWIAAAPFGPLERFSVQEGGPFNWPAATPALFDRELAGGGVLLDVGAHVLDGLVSWLGEPSLVRYSDDAEGGIEANCRLALEFPATSARPACRGTVRLSRDWPTENCWSFEFQRALVRWRVGDANHLEFQPHGSSHWLVTELQENAAPADHGLQVFTRQLADVFDAVATGGTPRVAAAGVLPSLRLIDRCYRERQPWTDSPA